MNDDLYKILGVGKDAEPNEIKKAHRKRAKETHPDLGGDPADFHLVSVAGRVLRSEEDRTKYDSTGIYEETREEDSYTKAEKILVEYFFKILASLTPDKVKHKDLVVAMLNSINQDKAQLKERRESTKVNIEMQKKVLKRLSRKGKKTTGLIFVALEGNISTLKISVENVTKEIDELDLASTLLADYSYQYEKQEEPEFGFLDIGSASASRRHRSNFIFPR